MSSGAVARHLQHPADQVVPLRLACQFADRKRPLSDFAVEFLAAQLMAAFGNDALPLAARQEPGAA
jgi:hypothetical protein